MLGLDIWSSDALVLSNLVDHTLDPSLDAFRRQVRRNRFKDLRELALLNGSGSGWASGRGTGGVASLGR